MAITREEAQENNISIMDSETINTDQKNALIEQVKQLLPNVVNSDNIVNAEALQDLFDLTNTTSNNQGYELTFAGKGIAKKKADTETNKQLAVDEELSKNFDTTKNVIIKGDNLDALKILKKNYHNQIKMIYIDPPYNTEQAFIYPDNFKTNEAELIQELGLNENTINYLTNTLGTNTHSKWLSFMYPRLLLAKELLKDDGVIFISIDDSEQANLKILCDEVFGSDNCLSNLIWFSSSSTQAGHFTNAHEYILSYAKKKSSLPFFKSIRKDTIKHGALKKISVKNPSSEITFKAGTIKFEGKDAVFTGELGGSEKQFIKSGELVFKDGLLAEDVTIEAGWAMKKQVLSWLAGKETFDTKGQKVLRFYFNSKGILFYEKERGTEHPKTTLSAKDYGSTSDGKKTVESLLSEDTFSFPKPEELLSKLTQYITNLNPNDSSIILDFFAGSGTTAHAIMNLNKDDGGNRKFLLVQLEEQIDENHSAYNFCQENNLSPDISSITIERVNRAGKKLLEENPELEEKLDIGYRVLTLEDKKIVNQEDNGNFNFEFEDKQPLNTLFNMLVTTGKNIGNVIETIKENCIYKVDNCIYILDKITADEVEKYSKQQVYFDSMIDFDLEDYLNLDLQNKENIQVIFY